MTDRVKRNGINRGKRECGAEIAKLVKDRDTWRDGYNRVAERMSAAEARVVKLEAALRVIREALTVSGEEGTDETLRVIEDATVDALQGRKR